MRPGKQKMTGEQDQFRARLDQIINMRRELEKRGQAIDWAFIDEELAGAFAENGRPAVPTRYIIGR